ncbi:acyl-CoA dehydrogenase family protein [Sulfobacillus thermosulfidooxidans]|uniref:acyl-CoA dehydrogenase family protein n=1 Tax=Sulfobacillus thermosulfidooxidans TaxID=28034 RepID=UPI00096BC5A2|nr:acyl-CoA dehydrogenase family protein [Sulfobacillus thermosulfidooxidans]OLZ09565.1 acyl-CoA dehydrogenase [Sulfobacillus thermosulfidooxidans]OLZ16129.1 acyl-CoA dehydrogenase [Sulfobacillus thermosulfidooxidans]OLZ18023.1 acyl-CoA dehydrogenase [Sulfobacillus thermosulfidooxidans]
MANLTHVGLTDEQQLFRETVRRLAEDKVKPRAQEIDESGEFPWDIVELFREYGLLGVAMPEEYGGGGADLLTFCIAVEEIARVCATSALIIAAQHLGAMPILIAGNIDQKRRYLPAIARGERLSAFALTEPEAGSDAGGTKTRAIREGDHYRLTGSKVFITNGGLAKTMVVFASTDSSQGTRGISAFIVELDQPGVMVGRIEKKMGIKGSQTAQLLFDNVLVDASNRLGDEGEGFKIAMRTLDRTRPGIAAQALGIAQGALDVALDYLYQRQQFGASLSQFEGLQFMVADMQTQIEASRQLLYRAAEIIETAGFESHASKEVTRYSAMAKLMCSDTAMRVTTDAVQLLGGYGYIRDYPVERMMRDAKITQIYEGTNQIQRLVIFRNMEHGGF